jgi:hypothetical protein
MGSMLEARRLTNLINTQKEILAQYRREGNEVGAKRTEKKIKELQKQLNEIK